MIEDLIRSAFLRDHAAIHKEYAVGDLPRKSHLMGYDHSSHSCLYKVLDNMKNLSYHLRIKGGSRLIKKHNIRFHRQRAHDRKTLFLSAGELLRELVLLIRKTNAV